MKRNTSFRNSILSAGSFQKRKKLMLLLEELSKPEIDISTLSEHMTMTFSQMQQQSVMVIPQFVHQMQKQSEPIVLEITKNSTFAENNSELRNDYVVTESFLEPPPVTENTAAVNQQPESHEGEVYFPNEPIYTNAVLIDEVRHSEREHIEQLVTEKQFEIIFSDSARSTDVDSDNHIVHSTTERTPAPDETAGTVNVPNSFPLFQIVHTGEVPEDLQHEIVRLIRQANPELDLNSITFKFKSPETVEIIANINS